MNRNFEVSKNILSFLDLSSQIKFRELNKAFFQAGTKLVVKLLLEAGVEASEMEGKSSQLILRLYFFHFSKNLLMIPVCDSFFQDEQNQRLVTVQKLFHQQLIRNVQISKNFVLFEGSKGELYLDLQNRVQSFHFQKGLFPLEQMNKFLEVRKHQLSHHFYYLKADDKLYIKVFDQSRLQPNPSVKSLSEHEVKFDARLFGSSSCRI